MMRRSSRHLVPVTTVALVASLTGLAGVSTAEAAGPGKQGSRAPDAWTIRSFPTSEFGVRRPDGLAWDVGRETLVVSGRATAGGTKLVGVTPREERRGKVRVAELEDGASMSFNRRSGQVTVYDGGRRAAIKGDSLSRRALKRQGARRALSSVDPAGAAYGENGTWHLLDAEDGAIVSLAQDGRVSRVQLRGVGDAELRGLAYQPAEGLLYVADVAGDELIAVEENGRVVRRQDLSGTEIDDLQGMVFAPSSDTTDPAGDLSLFVADAGSTARLGSIVEVSLAAAPAAAPIGTAVTADPSQVITTDTSVWNPPSPDPSGITFAPGSDRLIVSDGEVDEMPIYAGANLYHATRAGALGASSTGTSVPWSNEPTGLSFNPGNGHLFVADDDKKQIFEIASAGADGRFGTGDDGAMTNFRTSTFGATDPEGVGYDTSTGELLIIDGVNMELYRLAPGANGRFDGVAPGGDDVVRNFDVQGLGIIDPEGVAYDSARDTTVVVDDAAIWELDANGSLLNLVDLGSIGADKPAGITLAPASTGTGRRYYVVDRGVDNNSDPNENDGRLYEIEASLPQITNRPPAAFAGPDLLMDIGDTAQLLGRVSDDGNPSGALTTSWTQVSGPGVVTFGNAATPETTATFSLPGTYVLRLTVDDGQLTDSDDVTVQVFTPGSVRTVSVPIAGGADDALEGTPTGGSFVELASGDNELGNAMTGAGVLYPVLTGLRFANLPVPRGAEVVSARIQFRVDEVGTGQSSLTIVGEASDNAQSYQSTPGNISSRPAGAATVPWSPPDWNVVGEEGPAQLTPELAPLLQEVVNRAGWREGNAAAFMISGTGRRTAEAKDGLSPPMLRLQFRPNTAPTVGAGPDQSLPVPGTANLAGTVTDDGLPNPPGAVTSEWTVVSGPGSVTFGDAAQPRTTATFTEPGSYTLRLTASDSLRSAFDDVVVTVGDAPPPPAEWSVAAWLTHPRVLVGTTTQVRVAVAPALEGQPVLLKQRIGSSWRTVQRTTLSAGPRDVARFTVRPSSSGLYRFRAILPPRGGRDRTVVTGLLLRAYQAEITRVKPAGDEFVTVRNSGRVPLLLEGWRLRNRANGRTVELPQFRVRPGHLVRIHTGAGRTDANDLYLRRGRMWGAHGAAVLRDHLRRLVFRYRY